MTEQPRQQRIVGMDMASGPDITAEVVVMRDPVTFCDQVFGPLQPWQRRMLALLAQGNAPFLVAPRPQGRPHALTMHRICGKEALMAIIDDAGDGKAKPPAAQKSGQRQDLVTFKGRIRKVTDGGAYVITDGVVTRPVPIGWVTLNPPKVQLHVMVDITMARRLAEEKGFATRAGKGQGSLL